MKKLRLRLNMFSDTKLGTTRVMADIFPSDRSAPLELRRRLRNVPIKAGDDYDWTDVQLPAGRYDIQVTLPSGEMLTRDVDIPSDADTPVDVDLESPSPHEWLAVQHFQGNVGNRAQGLSGEKNWLLQGLERGQATSMSGSLDVLFAPEVPVDVMWAADPKPPGMAGEAWALVSSIIRDRCDPQLAVDSFWQNLPVHDSMNPIPPLFDDDDVRTYRFTVDGPAVSDSAGGHRDAWDGAQRGRFYVLARNDEAARLLCCPVPWFDLASGQQEIAFEVMSPLGSAGVTGAVRDTELGSIIGYLTRGSVASARRLVDRAEGMLFHKVSNPLGAAAGAYVMVLTERQRGSANWHKWIRNLYRRFEWIPDGAIAYASLKLNRQESDADVDEALEALLAGCRRGIPFYSMGVRWLLDGLTAFAEDDHYESQRDEIVAWLDKVRVVAQRVNYQQPFTSIQISHKSGLSSDASTMSGRSHVSRSPAATVRKSRRVSN